MGIQQRAGYNAPHPHPQRGRENRGGRGQQGHYSSCGQPAGGGGKRPLDGQGSGQCIKRLRWYPCQRRFDTGNKGKCFPGYCRRELQNTLGRVRCWCGWRRAHCGGGGNRQSHRCWRGQQRKRRLWNPVRFASSYQQRNGEGGQWENQRRILQYRALVLFRSWNFFHLRHGPPALYGRTRDHCAKRGNRPPRRPQNRWWNCNRGRAVP